MSSGFVFSSMIEVLLAVAVIVILVKEQKLAEWEEKLFARFRKKGKHAVIINAKDEFSHCA